MKKKHIILRIIILLFFLFLGVQVNPQEQKTKEKGQSILESKLTISDFSYPRVWWSTEQHSNFTFSYKVQSFFLVELKGRLDSYLIADVIKIPITTKWYATDKFYLFSGIELESERDKLQLNLPSPQLKYKNGFGYDVKNNFILQFEHNLHFNKSVIGAYGTPSLFSLKGKYKF